MAVAAALLAVAATAPADAHFSDVPGGSFYEDAVEWMLQNELTTGTGPGCFEPDRILTRAEAATFLHRLAGEPTPMRLSPFTDVTTAWAIEPVAWMAEQAITTGVGGGRFAPSEPVTRGQFATFLHRYADPDPAPQHQFSDIVSGWQQAAVSWLAAEQITTGTSAGMFSPDGYVTRGQLATFLHRYAGLPPVTPETSMVQCRRPLVIHAVGDVNFDPGYGPHPQRPYSDAWSGVGLRFLNDDLTIINLECVPSTEGIRVPKTYNFRCPIESLAPTREAGVDVANLANNHGGDYGIPALLNGVANVAAAGISPVGAGVNLTAAVRPAVIERNGVTIAVLGFNTVNNTRSWEATETQAGMAYGHIDSMVAAVRAADEVADYVFVTIHWGIEKTYRAAADDIPRAHALIDAGADAIFGHGPHRIQPLEFYGDRPIFWSLGNFVWHNLTSESAVAEVEVAADGTITARLLPATIESKGQPVLNDSK